MAGGVIALLVMAAMQMACGSEIPAGMRSIKLRFDAPFAVMCRMHNCGEGDCMVGRGDDERRRILKDLCHRRSEMWRKLFIHYYGISWPEGSSISCDESDICEHGYTTYDEHLTITSTPEVLVKIVQGRENFKLQAQTASMIALDICIVEASYEALAASGLATSPQQNAYATFKRLLSRKDASVFARTQIISRQGSESTAFSNVKCRYPQDFAVSTKPSVSSIGSPGHECINGLPLVEPQNFKTQEVGLTATADCNLFVDQVGLVETGRFQLTLHDRPQWKDYGADIPLPSGASCRLKMEQPFFSERLAIDTHLKLEPEKMFAFIGPSHGKDKKPLAVFITPHIIGAAPFNSIDN